MQFLLTFQVIQLFLIVTLAATNLRGNSGRSERKPFRRGKQASTQVPKVTLSNGKKMPILGLGTWQANGQDVENAVKWALEAGYRLIDTAYIYGNERDIGRALGEVFKAGKIKREDVFLTTKVWRSQMRYQNTINQVRRSLRDLKVNYLDLVLIHWPSSNARNLECWRALEEAVQKGWVKSIGLSNFNQAQIEHILKNAKIKPVNLQVLNHPRHSQRQLIKFCNAKNITMTAYSSLRFLLQDPTIVNIARKYNKTPAQILIKYQVQRNVIAIPKSSKKSHIEENLNVFDFTINSEDMNTLEKMDVNEPL